MVASTSENGKQRGAARAVAGQREDDLVPSRWYDEVAAETGHDRRAAGPAGRYALPAHRSAIGVLAGYAGRADHAGPEGQRVDDRRVDDGWGDDRRVDGEWVDGEWVDGEWVDDGWVDDGWVDDGWVDDHRADDHRVDGEWVDGEWVDGEWVDGEVEPEVAYDVEFWDDRRPRQRRLGLAALRRGLPVRLALAAAAVVLVAAALIGTNRSSETTTEDATPTTFDDGAAGDPDTISGERLATDGATSTTGVPGLPSPSATDGTTAAAGSVEGDAAGVDAAATDDLAGQDHAAVAGGATAAPGGDHSGNLAMIMKQTVRNRNHDDSPWRDTPSSELVPSNHYGPRSEYLNNPGGNPEQSFPVPTGGQFRAGCEFSHFAYDDPLIYPGQPGASHLHMFFGNTDVNAYTTADSLLDSGSSTCNGQELNRTGYWAPAMFDGNGNVRIPERVVVYYKGEGQANGKAEVFPDGAAMIATDNINTIDGATGGAAGKFNFVCSDQWSGEANPVANTMPACDGNRFLNLYGVRDDPHVVLEMNVKFPQCWNGKDASNPDNFHRPANGSWYGSQCTGEFNRTLVNLEYFINYKVEIGENTKDWYLASDVDPTTRTLSAPGGTTVHADWWTGWHKATNQLWIDNCVNHKSSSASGCGFGYLTDGGPNGSNPVDGPALKYREQYTGPSKVPAIQLHEELCPGGGTVANATAAAYCHPAGGPHHGG